MTFIEDLFGFRPDGGSGSFELALVLVPLLILAAWIVVRRRSRRLRL
jgi:hypothetical protein